LAKWRQLFEDTAMSIAGRESGVFDSDQIADAEALIRDGRAAEAASRLTRYLESGRGGLLARLLLIRARIASGESATALALARDLAVANPHFSEGALALGEALASAEMLPAAIAEFQRTLRLAPELDAARLGLAKAWLDAGEPDKAEEAISHVRDDTGTAELRQRVLCMRAQLRSDPGYVRHLFDQFSSDYDARMRGQLAYAAPEILRSVAELVLPAKNDLRVLDLGCGTGLSGLAFQDMASRLDGIDLSPAMIEKARAKEIYDNLLIGDIETMKISGSYDLVVAADTLVYLGELDRMLVAVAALLARSGFLLFSVEKHPGHGFELGPKRRWRHAEGYLRERAAVHGFEIAGLVTCTPRTEAGVPIEGFACAFEKVG
jgi:predicted TPR repeat methyltransferase